MTSHSTNDSYGSTSPVRGERLLPAAVMDVSIAFERFTPVLSSIAKFFTQLARLFL